MAKHIVDYKCMCGEPLRLLHFKGAVLAREYIIGVKHKTEYVSKVAVPLLEEDAVIAETLLTNTNLFFRHFDNVDEVDKWEKCAWAWSSAAFRGE